MSAGPALGANASWAACVAWFQTYAADGAWSWAAPFPALLEALHHRPATVGLYAHRWATSVVVSRFAAPPDRAVGPRLVLLPLPGPRLDVRVLRSHSRLATHRVWTWPTDLAVFDPALRFVAGEGPPPEGL